MKKRKTVITIVLILIVIGVGACFLRGKLNTKPVQQNIKYTVRKETSENIIEISGNISAANEQKMQASGSGTIKAIHVKEGQKVKEGQLLIELDSTSEEYNLAKQDYDIQQKTITGARKEVELMKKQREMLVKKLEDRKVYARFDGVVAQLKVSEGDIVVAQDDLGTILDRSYLSATVEVVETDAGKLKIDQKVHFEFPAYEENLNGYVLSYPSVSRITNRGATVVDVEVRIDNPPQEILPGYSFTGKIEISEPEELLLVEQLAIGYESGKPFAEIETGETTQRVEVSVEPYNSMYVKVLGGLKEGDVLKQQSLTRMSGSRRSNSGGGMPPR